MTFEKRAYLSEMMDGPCTYEEFRACLRDLSQVNRMTGSYRPTLQWLRRVARPGSAPFHIVDVGCGGGDMLREVERWARREGVAVRLTGIDLNPYAARAAREFTPQDSEVEWVTGDAFSYRTDIPVDVVVSSLFTHHLPDTEIVRFVRWMEAVTARGWFINDLHRERVPYFGFQALAAVMRWHHFVRNDGPVSIRRAFRIEDWQGYVSAAGVSADAVQVTPFRPARLCVSRVKA